MQTYYMLGRYSSESLKKISAQRTEDALKLIEELGGEMILMDVLLGHYDLAIIARFPGNNQALKASLALGKRTGISFTSCPAIRVDEFDRMAPEL